MQFKIENGSTEIVKINAEYYKLSKSQRYQVLQTLQRWIRQELSKEKKQQ